jgi:hypothetical protein
LFGVDDYPWEGGGGKEEADDDDDDDDRAGVYDD